MTNYGEQALEAIRQGEPVTAVVLAILAVASEIAYLSDKVER